MFVLLSDFAAVSLLDCLNLGRLLCAYIVSVKEIVANDSCKVQLIFQR